MDELPNPITRSEQYLAKIAGAEPTLPTPITREERYLAKIAGEDVDIPPAPITRTEQYLAAIVEGGGGVEVESLSVTANGTYTASEGKAYSPVSVAVENSYAAGDEGKVVSNGALVAQTSDSVTENGTVDTTLISSLEVNVPQGGGGEAPEKDVNFIDYDGTILYSYTAQEFAALDALPELVSHEGMAAATAWNWTLANAKTYVAKYSKLIIGQEYERTEIDIELTGNMLSPYLGFAVNGTAVIDWGDNTPTTSVSGTSYTTTKYTQHAYATGGKYTIRISGDFSFYFSGTYHFLLSTAASPGSYSAANVICARSVKGIRLKQGERIGTNAFRRADIRSISIPRESSIASGFIDACGVLKYVSFYNIQQPGDITLSETYALKRITLPDVSTPTTFRLQNYYGLEEVIAPDNIRFVQNSFSMYYGLRLLKYPPANTTVTLPTNAIITRIELPATVTSFAVSSSTMADLYIAAETPPTLSGTIPNICLIHVPHGTLEAYQAADGWSNYASCIVEMPE